MRKTLYLEVDEKKALNLSKECIKKKEIKLIVTGEEVYILNMTLPRVKKDIIRRMIHDELHMKFKNTSDIMFDYSILSKSKNNIQTVVFCFHWNGDKLVRNIMESGGVLKGVLPIQFHVLEKHSREINKKNYYFIFIYINRIYIIEAIKGVVVMNRVLKSLSLNERIQYSEEIKQVYHLNIDKNVLSDCFESGFEFVDLGSKL